MEEEIENGATRADGMELIALEPAGAQLKPIHEVSRSNVCCTES